MRVERLRTVDAMIAFDLDCPVSAGGTRLALDVSEAEVCLLARAMTYKLAVLGVPVGGAKGAIRASAEERDEAVRRYCEEILPLVREGRFFTATDLGTYPEDFAALPGGDDLDPAVEIEVTGLGVVVAAETALTDLAGRTMALEGFGKVGRAAARAARERGARLVAVSTVRGCVRRPAGLDVDQLLLLADRHGDDLVDHLGGDVLPAAALYETEADVLVPGARTASLDEAAASAVRARVVAPAANVPYTRGGLRSLAGRGVLTLPDFVCNCGAALAHHAPPGASAAEIGALIERRIGALTRAVLRHEEGPFAGACQLATEFLRTWADADQLPLAPPLA